MYTYKAQISRIIDGDSVVCLIDLGFSVMLKQSVRLFAIDTAETRGGTQGTKALGNLAKDYLKNELPEGCTVMLRTYIDKRGKFGRVLASIYKQEGDGFQTKSLNTALLDMGWRSSIRSVESGSDGTALGKREIPSRFRKHCPPGYRAR